MTVIVTSAKSRIAYNIVKSLGQRGVRVVSSDFVPTAMSFMSRYSHGHFLYPSPFCQDGTDFIRCMLENIIRLRADVLIPVLEETFLVSRYKAELSRHVSLVVPDYEKILLAHNKHQWEAVARNLKIRMPESFDLEEVRGAGRSLATLPYPLLIKPKQGGGGWGITEVRGWQQLEKLLAEEKNGDHSWDRFYLQQKIDGEIHCVAMLFNNGGLRARLAYRQVREYPAACGQATCRISIRSPEAEDHLQRFLESVAWHGICQADFVVDRHTGASYLIDINPRFWGSLVQGVASGVDFPYLYYKIATEGDVAPVPGFATGIVTRWVGGDLRTFFPSLQRREDKMAFVKEFFHPGHGRVVTDDFSFSDPLPFLAWGVDVALRALRPHAASTPTSLKGVWE